MLGRKLRPLVLTTKMTSVDHDLNQPDIEYHPDYEKYLQRRARRLAENPKLRDVPLPSGFPKRVEGPIVWEGKDWTSEGQWVYRLSELEMKEIDDALAYFRSKSDPSILRLSDFTAARP